MCFTEEKRFEFVLSETRPVLILLRVRVGDCRVLRNDHVFGIVRAHPLPPRCCWDFGACVRAGAIALPFDPTLIASQIATSPALQQQRAC